MGLTDSFRNWRQGRDVRNEVRLHVEALLAKVNMLHGPGRGVELSHRDPIEMLAVQEVLKRRQDLTVLHFSGTLQLGFKLDTDQAIRKVERDYLETHGILSDDPHKIVVPD